MSDKSKKTVKGAGEKATKYIEYGKNIKGYIDGDVLTLKIDLTKDFGPSSSGKTNFVATTSGFAKLDEDGQVMLSVNCCKYAKPKKK